MSKAHSGILFTVCYFFMYQTFAQYSPSKMYSQDPLKYDTTSKLYQTAYQPKAPIGAPNIVLIMLDDVGFSTAGVVGGRKQKRINY